MGEFLTHFWSSVTEIVKVVEHIVKVMWMVDGDKLTMGYISKATDQPKEQIRAAYKDIK